MPESNRRDFLRRAGFGAAALSAAAAVPALVGTGTAAAATPVAAVPAPAPEAAPSDLGAPVVAYLEDAPSGEFRLMIGARTIEFTDKALAARITAALA
ncbi:hypothetical protein GCM10027047_23050 [Rhodococcus aerolatus]